MLFSSSAAAYGVTYLPPSDISWLVIEADPGWFNDMPIGPGQHLHYEAHMGRKWSEKCYVGPIWLPSVLKFKVFSYYPNETQIGTIEYPTEFGILVRFVLTSILCPVYLVPIQSWKNHMGPIDSYCQLYFLNQWEINMRYIWYRSFLSASWQDGGV